VAEQTLTRNAAECIGCGAVIESKHRHDFRQHNCQQNLQVSFFVDGGLEYVRRGWGGPGLSSHERDHFIERSEYASS
jgi:hypothetical protein